MIKKQPKLVKTNDGSISLQDNRTGEWYHSYHGARQESAYVFVEQGLAYWLTQNRTKKKCRILEFGTGTGLNIALTQHHAQQNKIQIKLFTLEKYPLEKSVWQKLAYTEIPSAWLHLIHQSSFNQPVVFDRHFTLTKYLIDFNDLDASLVPDQSIDVVYYDAFSPTVQPNLWSTVILKKAYQSLSKGGFLVTYCAQGQFKRNLKAVGFEVESLPGPIGKREMVRAVKK